MLRVRTVRLDAGEPVDEPAPVLPDLTRYDAFLSPASTATVLPFLGESGSRTRAEQVGQGR